MASINLFRESIKVASAQTMEEQKSHDDIDPNVADGSELDTIWSQYLTLDAYSQCAAFLNANWHTLGAHKNDIVRIYLEYAERARLLKFASVHIGAWSGILEKLCKANIASVMAATAKHMDRASMAKRCHALGFKLNNNAVSMLETLLFVFAQKRDDFVSKPPTPCSGSNFVCSSNRHTCCAWTQ